jgi:anti-sigma factor RsiW
MSALLREKFYSRATPEVPAELRRIAKVSDRPSLPSSYVRRLRHFGAFTPSSPPRAAVTALVPTAAAGAAGAWPGDGDAMKVVVGSC